MAIRVAYQGIPGAYSEGAVQELGSSVSRVSGIALHPVPLSSFSSCFQAIRERRVDAALLPIENNLGGSIHANYDLLVRYDDVEIVAEHRFHVKHCLLAPSGTTLKDIKVAQSHPQALAQCQNWLRSRAIDAREFYDTAGAAADVAERATSGDTLNVAAVASAGAATRYGLEVLASGIEDAKGNTTRFLLVSRAPSVPTKIPIAAIVPEAPEGVRWRTSMVFAPRSNVPGALFKALSVFSLRDIDLTKLESRPATPGVHYDPTALKRFAQPSGQAGPPGSPGQGTGSSSSKPSSAPSPVGSTATDAEGSLIEYMFFLDVAAHRHDPRMVKAVDHLGEIASFVRVLGSYAASESKGADVVAAGAVESVQAAARSASADASSDAADGPADGAGSCGAAAGTDESVDKSKGSMVSNGAALQSRGGAASAGRPYKVGIIGFGVFGQFLAQGFLKHAKQAGKPLQVVATSRGDYTAQAEAMGATFALGLREFFSHSPDIVFLATSILSFASVLRRLPKEQLEGKLIVDVLSVKQHPKDLLLDTANVPASADILLTHPMFGPESGKHGWAGLPMVYEVGRTRQEPAAQARLEFALGLFRDQGCSMVAMNAEKHDELAAGTQFVTHLTGRVLHRLRLSQCEIATKGFEALLQLVENTCKDSFDLFLALYKHNKSSRRQLDALADALDEIRSELTAEDDGTAAGSDVAASRGASGPSSGAGDSSRDASAPHAAPAASLDEIPCAPQLRYDSLNPTIGAVEAPVTTMLHAKTVEMMEAGKDVLSLAVGAPDWKPPASVMQAAHQALKDGKTGYTSSHGAITLRQAVAKYVNRRHGVPVDPKSNVLVSNGSKQCLFQLCCALAPGAGSAVGSDRDHTADEILVPTPAWPSFLTMPRLTGLRVVKVATEASNGFRITPASLRASASSRTRAIILCNPGNPTGTKYDKADLEELARCLCEPELEHIVVIADEIYDRLVSKHAEPASSLFSLPALRGRVVLLNGVSKAWAMCGFRVGFMVGPADVVRMCSKIQSDVTSCASSIGQEAAIAALQPETDQYLDRVNEELDGKRQIFLEGIRGIGGGVSIEEEAIPTAAIYAMPSIEGCIGARQYSSGGTPLATDVDFCQALLDETGLALVPGTGFGCPGRVRFCLSAPKSRLHDALSRMRSFVSRISTK